MKIETPVKRGRGRPRKIRPEDTASAAPAPKTATKLSKRGRFNGNYSLGEKLIKRVQRSANRLSADLDKRVTQTDIVREALEDFFGQGEANIKARFAE